MSTNAIVDIPKPQNEQVPSYLPGSPEKIALKVRLAEMTASEIEIPLVIGGKEVFTGKTGLSEPQCCSFGAKFPGVTPKLYKKDG